MATMLRFFTSGTKKAFAKYPMLSNSLTYCGLYAAAEVTQQLILKEQPPHTKNSTSMMEGRIDWRKVGHVALIGLVFNGPVGYTWYRLLDKWLPGTARRTIIKKMIIDQLCACPPFICAFYVGISILERKKDIYASLKEKFIPSYLVGFAFWPPAQAVNFIFIPSHLRIVYVASAGFVWANVLCFINKRSTEPRITEVNPVKDRQISGQPFVSNKR
ncbi:mpv17-like protein [Antedon mediterranea]|uniref:mpv17-like protein n=1 Tax=Antedon mediterranea TaxID=105859 RepID=UPI003AF5C028